eukprot:PhF_6_TR42750/c0_g1_i3/m.64632
MSAIRYCESSNILWRGETNPVIPIRQSKPTFHFDVASRTYQRTNCTQQRVDTCTVEIQVCRNPMSTQQDIDIVITNGMKTLNWTISNNKKTKEPKSFDRLYDMVTKCGMMGLIVYAECTTLNDGSIEIAPTPLPRQR